MNNQTSVEKMKEQKDKWKENPEKRKANYKHNLQSSRMSSTR